MINNIHYYFCENITDMLGSYFILFAILLQSDYNASVRDFEEQILKEKDKEGFSVRYINDEIGKFMLLDMSL